MNQSSGGKYIEVCDDRRKSGRARRDEISLGGNELGTLGRLGTVRNDDKGIQVTELRKAPRAHGMVCAERLKMDRTAQMA